MVTLDPVRVARVRAFVHTLDEPTVMRELEREERIREDARQRRRSSGRQPGGNPRCGGCHKYMTFSAARCQSCGFHINKGWGDR